MRDNQKEYAHFIHWIATCKDLHEEDQIRILEHAADTCFINDWNVLYLECKSFIHDIRSSAH